MDRAHYGTASLRVALGTIMDDPCNAQSSKSLGFQAGAEGRWLLSSYSKGSACLCAQTLWCMSLSRPSDQIRHQETDRVRGVQVERAS